jgi:uracil-DNA glycosylase
MQNPRHARWVLHLLDINSGELRRIYYHDQRNFGTLKFSLSKTELDTKLASLGPDILDDSSSFTEEQFLQIMQQQKQDLNICKFLMDQSKLAGVGNYILSESLYRARIDPFASLSELNEAMRRRLYTEMIAVANESYQSQGLTRKDGGTHRNLDGQAGNFQFQLQCYGRNVCANGKPVTKETNGPHKRSIFYVQDQLFVPLAERMQKEKSIIKENDQFSPPNNKKKSRINEDDQPSPPNEMTTRNMKAPAGSPVDSLIAGLHDEGWKSALSDVFASDSFQNLATFLEQERASGATIFPPEKEIFAALNTCPLDKVKVVIVGQDPYHGPNQAHGLAFSVRRGQPPPPSLRNIVREVMEDVGIEEPTHGNLEHWAKQGVLLLNTVLTVRKGQANSHAKQGWEEFTDRIISEIDQKDESIVFLLWGSQAQTKAKDVDRHKHTVIQTSHPSPLGATKTDSPFLGSRCFSRANKALANAGKERIDWNLV